MSAVHAGLGPSTLPGSGGAPARSTDDEINGPDARAAQTEEAQAFEVCRTQPLHPAPRVPANPFTQRRPLPFLPVSRFSHGIPPDARRRFAKRRLPRPFIIDEGGRTALCRRSRSGRAHRGRHRGCQRSRPGDVCLKGVAPGSRGSLLQARHAWFFATGFSKGEPRPAASRRKTSTCGALDALGRG